MSIHDIHEFKKSDNNFKEINLPSPFYTPVKENDILYFESEKVCDSGKLKPLGKESIIFFSNRSSSSSSSSRSDEGIRIPLVPEPKEVVLISFDDINLTPVISLPEHLLNILLGWYDKCDSLLDIHNIDFKLTNDLSENLLSDFLYKPILKKHLDTFKNEYLPQYMKSLEIMLQLNKVKQVIYANNIDYFANKNKPKQTHTELSIIIPEELNQNKDKDKNTNKADLFFSGNHINDNLEEEFVSSSLDPVPFDNWMLYKDSFKDCFKLTPVAEKKNTIDVMVILHTHYLQTLVLKNPNRFEASIINNHSEYGFVKLFSYQTTDENLIKYITNEYDVKTFNNTDNINNTLLLTSQYVKNLQCVSKSNHSKTEESIVKKHITENYIISNDADKRMKASTLLNIIIDFIQQNKEILGKEYLNNITDKSFRIRLSTYLQDLGLQKKRYNDGYYYYGITKRQIDPMKELVYTGKMEIEPRIHRTLESFLKERNEEYIIMFH
jgi:hypothetical protein